jgi:hypothetical protein
MLDDEDVNGLGERERRLLAALPRESAPSPHEIDHLVSALRAEGFFRAAPRSSWGSWIARLAAAVLLLLLGGWAGARIATRNSLEAMLDRTDLSVSERILLMQRAGSAYVRASNGYAGSVAKADSTAVEVASQVLIGAAQAVAGSDLGTGVSSRLTAALRSHAEPAATPVSQRVIWF